MTCACLAGGCTTSQACPGEQLARAEVATIEVPASVRAVDARPIDGDHSSRLAILPGEHVVEWDFVFPNGFVERKQLAFRAVAGEGYRLDQRFFPAPHPGGPIGAAIDLIVDTTVLPLTLLAPPAPATGPPPGEYHMWIVEIGAEHRVIAGLPPDVPIAHAPLTFVPIDDDMP